MRVAPTVFPGPEEIGRALAAQIADGIAAKQPGKPYLLGCPSGRSPWSTYRALADEVARRRLDLSGVVIVMMDEYVEIDRPTAAMRRVDSGAAHSCMRFGRTEILERLNAGAGPGRGITLDRFWVPDPLEPGRYDARIAAYGGIDLFILASGASDGHIAFNPPGASADSCTRVVALGEQTRRDNLSTFPTFGEELDRVPRLGVTVGISTIRDLSRRVVMVVHGAQKTEAVRRLRAAESYEADWPATILSECADPQLFVDVEALADGAPESDSDHPETSPAVANLF